ncbi:MAG: ABC transporter permease [Desulfovibrionales bacterium]|nr:MAG: ABC transporter permease [Desulfovibrionales bacterium]
MLMHFKLAWRNIWRKPRRTLITCSAIVFAVVAAIAMQSINRGSYEAMIERMVSFSTGHLQLQDYRYEDESSLDNAFPIDQTTLELVRSADERIEHVVPRLETFMLAANEEYTRGAILLGIDTDKEHRFNTIRNHLTEGRFFEPDEQAVVLTQGLSSRLQLGVGDTLILIGQGRFGMSASGLFTITGLLEHPIREMNTQAVYMPLKTAQGLLSAENHLTALLISPQRERHTEQVAASIREVFADSELVVFTWPELMPELLELMELDLAGPRFITAILYVVIGFGFLGTVLTMTLERIREFGMLLSIGMSRGRLVGVVFLETFLISCLGVLSGMALAWLILRLADPIRLSGNAALALMDLGFEPVLPMSFALDQFLMQGLYVFFMAMLASLYPLVTIFRLNILDASRK